MDWNGMNLSEWRACENARAQYAKDPALYRLKLFLSLVLGYGVLVLFGWLLILSILFFIGLSVYIYHCSYSACIMFVHPVFHCFYTSIVFFMSFYLSEKSIWPYVG